MLTTSFPAHKQGFQSIFILEIANSIAKKGIDVDVVTPYFKASKKKKKEKIRKINVHRFKYFLPTSLQVLREGGGIPSNLRRSWFARLQLPFFLFTYFLKGLKISKKCDIIHSQWSLSGLVGVFIKKITKKPLLVTVRGSDLNMSLKNPIFKRIIKFVFKNADKITTVGENLKKSILSLGISKEKVALTLNGVNTDLFKKRDKNKIRKKIGLHQTKKIILLVGWLVKEKGIGYLINSIPNLENKNIQLLLIGEGNDKKLFKKQIALLKLKNNVFFLGTKSQEELVPYYNAADIFALPSLSEGRPNTILEAMASETPIISTSVGGIPELIINNKTGILIKPKNKIEIANSINKLLKNKKLQTKLGKNARKFIIDNKLNWEGCADKYIKEYKALLKC